MAQQNPFKQPPFPQGYQEKSNPQHIVIEFDYLYDAANDRFRKGKTYMKQ